MTATATGEGPKETPKDASASVIAQQAAMLNALPFSDTARFRRCRARLHRHAGPCADHSTRKAAWSGAWSPTASCPTRRRRPPSTRACGGSRGSTCSHGLFEVVPGVYQVRGLDIANMTLIEGDTRRDRGRHADLDRRRAGRDGALFQAPRPAPGRRRHLHPHPHRPLGRRARRARRGCAGERPRADHRAQSVHGARGLRKHHRRARDAAARAISVRAVAAPRDRAGRSIAASASRWRRARWRCCARPI